MYAWLAALSPGVTNAQICLPLLTAAEYSCNVPKNHVQLLPGFFTNASMISCKIVCLTAKAGDVHKRRLVNVA
jgi:hypothetical protein